MMAPVIPFASVCSGIGAPEVGWAPHGLHSVLASEIEAFPRAVLTHRFGAHDVRRSGRRAASPAMWGDFTALRVRHFRRLGLPLPRALVGGTPCQSFSVAGKRGSLSDPRGNLSLSFVRLTHALAAALAGHERSAHDGGDVFYAVWENVPGVLSTRDNAFGCFLAELVGADAPLVPPDAEWGAFPVFHERRYDVGRAYGWKSCRWPSEGMVEGPLARAAWRILDAQHFRVPQRRRRVFVVVGFGGRADPVEILFELDGLCGDLEAGGGAAEDVAVTLAGGARGRGGYSHDDVPMTVAKPIIAGGHGNNPLDENLITQVEAFGGANARGPIQIATALSAHAGPHGRLDFESETFVIGSLSASAGGADENDAEQARLVPMAFDTTNITSPANRSATRPSAPCHTLSAVAHPPAIAFSSKDHGADAGDIAPTLRAMGHTGSHANAGGQIAIAFNARQDPDVTGDIAGALDTMSPQAQAVAWSIMPQNSGKDYRPREVEVLQPLMAGGPVGGNQGGDFIQQTCGVRRLLPRECERLQSFPDDHTLIPWRGAAAEDCPDGPRYRALGNSMNVNVMRWLGRRLATSIRRADG